MEILLLLLAEALFATFLVNFYWNLRMKKLMESESRLLTKSGLIFFIVVSVNFANLLGVLVMALVFVEIIRSNAIQSRAEAKKVHAGVGVEASEEQTSEPLG